MFFCPSQTPGGSVERRLSLPLGGFTSMRVLTSADPECKPYRTRALSGEPSRNRGFSVCVVLPALITIRTCSESALTRCFHEGGGREGGWRNLRLALFFFSSSSDCHNILFSCLSFCLCVFFFRGAIFPPSTQINIVLCHANGYVSLPCSDFRESGSQEVYLSFLSLFSFCKEMIVGE